MLHKLADSFGSVIFALIVVCAFTRCYAQDQSLKEKPTFQVVPRLNSAGHFPYSGALINKHLNFDLNLLFEHKNFGFFIFKSLDLEDKHSVVNYLQPGIYKIFRLTSDAKLGTYAGYAFSQTKGFRDPDSDYYASAALYWTVNEHIKIENTSLFFDLMQSYKFSNRLLITYQIQKFSFDFYLWQRIVFESDLYATSASVAVNFPKIKITDMFSIQNTISFQGYLTSYKPEWALQRGVLVSIAFPITLSE